MRRRSVTVLALGLAIALLLAAAACGDDGDSEAAPETTTEEATEGTPDEASDGSVTVELREFSGSGQSGTAVLMPTPDGFLNVTIEVNAGDDQYGAIYRGTCEALEPVGDRPFAYVERNQHDGTFEAIAPQSFEGAFFTLDDLEGGDYVVNVSNGYREAEKVGSERLQQLESEGIRFIYLGEDAWPMTACGEIPRP